MRQGTTHSDLTLLNKRLIQRCANTLTRQQELSAPEVVSYLMGWGDRFISHHFETIHWFTVVDLLKKSYPILMHEPVRNSFNFILCFKSIYCSELHRSFTQSVPTANTLVMTKQNSNPNVRLCGLPL
jgi:hypothetical protein